MSLFGDLLGSIGEISKEVRDLKEETVTIIIDGVTEAHSTLQNTGDNVTATVDEAKTLIKKTTGLPE